MVEFWEGAKGFKVVCDSCYALNGEPIARDCSTHADRDPKHAARKVAYSTHTHAGKAAVYLHMIISLISVSPKLTDLYCSSWRSTRIWRPESSSDVNLISGSERRAPAPLQLFSPSESLRLYTDSSYSLSSLQKYPVFKQSKNEKQIFYFAVYGQSENGHKW